MKSQAAYQILSYDGTGTIQVYEDLCWIIFTVTVSDDYITNAYNLTILITNTLPYSYQPLNQNQPINIHYKDKTTLLIYKSNYMDDDNDDLSYDAFLKCNNGTLAELPAWIQFYNATQEFQINPSQPQVIAPDSPFCMSSREKFTITYKESLVDIYR